MKPPTTSKIIKKKRGNKKRKKWSGEKEKSKNQDCSVTFKSKNLEILLSVHARTSQANILHLDQGHKVCDL